MILALCHTIKNLLFYFLNHPTKEKNLLFSYLFSFKQKKEKWMRNFLIYFSVQNIPNVLGWAWTWLDIRTFLLFIGYLTFFCQKTFRKRRKLTLSKFLKLLSIHEFCQLTLGYEKKKFEILKLKIHSYTWKEQTELLLSLRFKDFLCPKFIKLKINPGPKLNFFYLF